MIARPPVSICLLTYNRSHLLPATLDSILAQSFTDYELIVSDDCSTDATEEICRAYARCDERIRYIRNVENLGMPGNLNAALQAASGCYLADLHDGDLYRSDLIARWKDALDTYPTAGFVFNAYRSQSRPELVLRESYPPIIDGRRLAVRLLFDLGSCVFGTVMARRDVYERLAWFDPRFGNYSDVDMWMRIAREYDVAYVDEPLIDVMAMDDSRFYAFVHWKVVLWILSIHAINLQRCRTKWPDTIGPLVRKYPTWMRRYLFYNMLICVKHRRWDRVKEGLAIWRDARDPIIMAIGRFFGNQGDAPKWYSDGWWALANID